MLLHEKNFRTSINYLHLVNIFFTHDVFLTLVYYICTRNHIRRTKSDYNLIRK